MHRRERRTPVVTHPGPGQLTVEHRAAAAERNDKGREGQLSAAMDMRGAPGKAAAMAMTKAKLARRTPTAEAPASGRSVAPIVAAINTPARCV
jgi:hypothetical protein